MSDAFNVISDALRNHCGLWAQGPHVTWVRVLHNIGHYRGSWPRSHSTLHYRNQGGHNLCVLHRPFLLFLMAEGAILNSKLVIFQFPNVMILLNLEKKG